MQATHHDTADLLPHELGDDDLITTPGEGRRLRWPTRDAIEAFLGSVPATFGLLAAAVMMLWGAYFAVPDSGPWVAQGYSSSDPGVIVLLLAGMGLFCVGALRAARQGVRALMEA
jgi:uncharacterized membrane protein